jgi:hypothetical protein
MVASVSEVQNEDNGVVVVVGGGGTKENYLKIGKCEVKSVAEIYLKISYSFPCQRIPICITVIHFRQHAKISEKVKNTQYKHKIHV